MANEETPFSEVDAGTDTPAGAVAQMVALVSIAQRSVNGGKSWVVALALGLEVLRPFPSSRAQGFARKSISVFLRHKRENLWAQLSATSIPENSSSIPRKHSAMAPANPPSEVPNEERMQEAIRKFLKPEKAYEEVGGECRKSQKPEALEPETSEPEITKPRT